MLIHILTTYIYYIHTTHIYLTLYIYNTIYIHYIHMLYIPYTYTTYTQYICIIHTHTIYTTHILLYSTHTTHISIYIYYYLTYLLHYTYLYTPHYMPHTYGIYTPHIPPLHTQAYGHTPYIYKAYTQHGIHSTVYTRRTIQGRTYKVGIYTWRIHIGVRTQGILYTRVHTYGGIYTRVHTLRAIHILSYIQVGHTPLIYKPLHQPTHYTHKPHTSIQDGQGDNNTYTIPHTHIRLYAQRTHPYIYIPP